MKHATPEQIAAAVKRYHAGVPMLQVMSEFHMAYETLKRGLKQYGVQVRAAKPKAGQRVDNSMTPLVLKPRLCACGAHATRGEPDGPQCRTTRLTTCSCKRVIEGGIRMGKPWCRICGREISARRAS